MSKKYTVQRALYTIAVLAGMLTFGVASARLVDLYASQGLALPSVSARAPMAGQCGIPGRYVGSYAQNVALEGCLLDSGIMGAVMPEDNYDTYLTAPIGASAATVYVNKLPTVVTESVYTIFASDGRTVSEKIYCTGVTTTPAKSLTGCLRGISSAPNPDGSITETAGTGISHSQNSRIAITDNINFSGKALSILNGYMTSSLKNTDAATFTFINAFPIVSSSGFTGLPTTNGMLATKYYVDTVGAGGFTSVNVSTTRGLSVDGSSPEKVGINVSSTTGMAFDAGGKLYQKIDTTTGVQYSGGSAGIGINTTTLVSLVASTTPAASYLPIADSYGYTSAFTGLFGSGASGTLSINSGTTTIDLGGASYFELNYENLLITGTGALVFTNPSSTGTAIKINVRGSFVVTSTASPAINATGCGATSTIAGLSNFSYPGAGSSYSGSSGGAGGAQPARLTNNFFSNLIMTSGSGGGNGDKNGSETARVGGAGGGALLFYIGGNINFTGTIWSKGQDGIAGVGTGSSCSNAYYSASGGGGASTAGTTGGNSADRCGTGNFYCSTGGGGGGSVIIRYLSQKATSVTGSIVVTGGSGQNEPGGCKNGGGVASGGGGAGYWAIKPF